MLKNIKIKIEIDINPPSGASYETKYKLLPSPHEIRLYDQSSLFAGKIHAILYRNRNGRIKGRDLYDYIFFLANNYNVNIDLIRNKLIDSNYIKPTSRFDIEILKKLLINKFKEIDYDDAKKDVLPFINDYQTLNIWNEDFFINITTNLN